MQYLLLLLAVLCSLGWCQPVFAQTYHDQQRQNREYKSLQDATKRAYAVPDRPAASPGYKPSSPTSPSPSNSSSRSTNAGGTIAPASASDWSDGGAYMRRQAEVRARIQAREDAWTAKVNRFAELAKDVPRNEANYDRLNNLAQQAGIDYYTATRLNSAYAPQSVELPFVPSYKQPELEQATKQGHALRDKQDYANAIVNYEKSVGISNDPLVRAELARLYMRVGRYRDAAASYADVMASPVTNKFPNSKYYEELGKAALYDGQFKLAQEYLGKEYQTGNYEHIAYPLLHAYWLDDNDAEAFKILSRIKTERPSGATALLEVYFHMVQSRKEEAAAALATAKTGFSSLTFTGVANTDLAAMMYEQAKKQSQTFPYWYARLLLDIAVELDGSNKQMLQTRKEYNAYYKIGMYAARDEQLLK